VNIHHLELFYYVARHRGIVAACRHIPYGIQQPAVSAQIATLEGDLGVKLFNRRPFQLTPQGGRLYEFIAPFFARLGDVELEIKGEMAQELRLVGPTQLMRDHLPEIIAELRMAYPKLRLNLQEADQQRSEERIALGEADIAVSVLEDKPNPGFRTETLTRLPLVLLVRSDCPHKTARAAIQQGAARSLPLIALPAHERICRIFKECLRAQSLAWPVAMEVNSNDLIALYVSHGLGAGLTVRLPRVTLPPTLRELPLTGMPALPIGAFWRGKLTPIGEAFLTALKARAQLLG
jgi:DNA-binding transcriptional LysR family regulator